MPNLAQKTIQGLKLLCFFSVGRSANLIRGILCHCKHERNRLHSFPVEGEQTTLHISSFHFNEVTHGEQNKVLCPSVHAAQLNAMPWDSTNTLTHAQKLHICIDSVPVRLLIAIGKFQNWLKIIKVINIVFLHSKLHAFR